MEREKNGDSISVTKTNSYSIGGLLEVFYNPAKLFNDVSNNPKVLVPYIVYGLLMLVFFYTSADFMVKMQIDSPAFQQRFEGGVNSDMKELMRLNVIFVGTIMSMMIPLVTSGLAYFWGNIIFGRKEKFKKVFSVVIFSALLIAVGRMIVLPIILAKESIMVSMSPAVLFSHLGADSFLYVLFSKLDIFIIWEIIVAGIGFSIIYNFPRNIGYRLSVLSIGMISIFHILYSAFKELI